MPPISDESELRDQNLDIVFSTLPVQKKIEGCSIIQLSFIQDDLNRLQILSVIDQKKRENKNKVLKSKFHQYFFEENFYVSHKHSDKDSVLSYLCGELKKKGFIDSVFIKDLYEREKTCSTGFNGFSIPHSIKMNASQSCIAVFISTEGITWDKKEVHIVFLLAISKVDRVIFADLYEALVHLLNDSEGIRQMRKSSSFLEFKHIIFDEQHWP